MNKTFKFKYGKTFLNVELPGKAEILNIQEPEFCISKEKFTKDFASYLPGNLSNCTAASFAVSIVVADKTRLCDYSIYLPWVVDILYKHNIQKSQVQFFIAYGTHARQSDDECCAAYGDVYKNYKFIHHECDDKSLFTYLGKSKRGTKIHVRKDILETDLIITFGALSHHYFAGYGGGRKLLFPGLGYKSDIYQNHSLFLDKKLKKLESGCQPGQLENNPLAEDLKQIDDAVKIPRIAIHGILDSKARVCKLVVGKSYNDFLNACNTLDGYYKIGNRGNSEKRNNCVVKKQYDLVMASCGGFPKDINFIQTHKAINNAAMFVKDKGTLIIFAQCSDGIGSDTFLEYFDLQNFSRAFNTLANSYQGNGGTALSMMDKVSRINIFIKTDLDDKVCSKIGMQKVDTAMIQQMLTFPQDRAAKVNRKSDNCDSFLFCGKAVSLNCSMAVINNASLLIH